MKGGSAAIFAAATILVNRGASTEGIAATGMLVNTGTVIEGTTAIITVGQPGNIGSNKSL
jgi:hypothetical protein